MHTLNANYQKNINVMKENLKRGMTATQANQVIQMFEDQFKKANLYLDEEKHFINELRGLVIEQTTGIKVVQL